MLRQEAIDRLTDAFASDQLELADFEARVERAEAAVSEEALEVLLADLRPSTALVPRRGPDDGGTTALVAASEVPQKRSLVTVFGNTARDKRWTVPRQLKVVSVFGSTDLDFREAQLAPGVTEVTVVSVMAGVQLLVPPGLPVEVEGSGILGSFEQLRDDEPDDVAERDQPPREQPARLRIRGLALLSGVEVERRLPGETRRQANKRRKRQRKALRAAATDRLLGERSDEVRDD